MPFQLTEQQQQEIFQTIREAFRDLAYFDQVIADKLRVLIRDTNRIEIDTKTTRKLTERYYDVGGFTTEEDKAILNQLHIVLRTTYVLILSYNPENRALFFKNADELKSHYPQFRDQDDEELRFLLNFRNYMKLALKIIPPRLAKQLLLKVVARLEGSGREYITGGGQKQCVTRRVQIYEKEGDVQPEKRPDRNRRTQELANPAQPAGATTTSRKRNQPLSLVRGAKLRRLPSDDVQRLTRGPNDPVPVSLSTSTASFGLGKSFSSSSSGIMSLPPSLPPLGNAGPALPPLGGPPPLMNPSNMGGQGTSGIDLPQSLGDMGEQVDIGEWLSEIPITPLVEGVLNTAQNEMPPPPLPPSYTGYTNPYSFPPPGSNTYSSSQQSIPMSQICDMFPPSLSRATSEALNRLLPGGELWNSWITGEDAETASHSTANRGNEEMIAQLDNRTFSDNSNCDSDFPSLPPPIPSSFSQPSRNLQPLDLMRSISWDVYNGTLSEDLRNILGSF
jgi:hypothetical protein